MLPMMGNLPSGTDPAGKLLAGGAKVSAKPLLLTNN
jgi:hypothetical protein